MKQINIVIKAFSLIFMFSLVSCEPDQNYLVDVDYNKVGYVLQDNFNLSIFSSALDRTGLDNDLLEKGPFTVMVPSNEALLASGYGEQAMLDAPSAWLTRMLKYHILEGYYELDKLPFTFNQEILTANNTPLYVTRWIKDQDTIVTVNGSEVNFQALKASNGLVLVTDRLLGTDVKETVVDCIQDNPGLTLFAQALVRSGLDREFKELPLCTIFAPSNTAMSIYGYGTVQDINNADPETLRRLLKYHVQAERKFINDFMLVITPDQPPATGNIQMDYYNPNTGQVTQYYSVNALGGELNIRMMDNNRAIVKYERGTINVSGNIQSAARVSLKDIGGEVAVVSLLERDYLAKNGTVHIINKVLKHTL